ncbi:MAG TPA: hypothetical protein VLA49_03820 [Anaerolineales bacterium]|nr:hypothetical protein [Anaerolineales bacterium]
MKINHLYSKWAILSLSVVLIVAGCSSNASEPTQSTTEPAASPEPAVVMTAEAIPTQETLIVPSPTAEPVAEPIVDEHLLYEDDFSNPSSGWSQQEFDNYFYGYHEPEYYHVEVHEANDSALITVPDKPLFTELTIEVKVFVDPSNSAESGDFRYGLVFHRSGALYYAFTISPSTHKWYFLKNSANALEILKEGVDDTIQGLTAEDRLRVDVEDSNFFLHINDQLIGQVNDPDYSSGEVGLYVQTFDSPRVHVHFDELVLREVETPQLICSVITTAMRVRSGPSITFDPPIAFLERGTNFDVLGRTSSGDWIKIQFEESQRQGWTTYSEDFISCNFDLADLPVIEP